MESKECQSCKNFDFSLGWYDIKFIDADTNEDLLCSLKQPVPPLVGDKVFVFGWYEVVERYFDYTRGTYVTVTVRQVKV